MRIISKFKDYYDSASSFGVDLECVFNRIPSEIVHPIGEVGYDDPLIVMSHHFLDTSQIFVLGYCGGLIPFIKFYDTDKKQDLFFYDIDEFSNFYEKLDKKKKRYSSFRDIKKIKTFFQEIKTNSLFENLFFKYHTPIFLITSIKKNSNDLNYHLNIENNPNLKSINFQKIKDANSVFQDIFQYLSGVLGNIEKDTVHIEDKYKIQQHGFDTKYGFRKRKI